MKKKTTTIVANAVSIASINCLLFIIICYYYAKQKATI